MASITRFIERRLKLQVNAEKSAVAHSWQRSFLGLTLTEETTPRRGRELRTARGGTWTAAAVRQVPLRA